jgi:hypothetical protein
MSKASRKSVVVVGGGAAGATIARLLSSKINPSTATLTLVTARPVAVHLPASIRMTTTGEDKLEETSLIPYDSLLVNGNGTIKVGRVTAIEQGKESRASGTVVLSTGERIQYDILVLAPGSEWDGPLAFPDDRAALLEHIRSWRRKFENASGIILAGGGAVGIGMVLSPRLPSLLRIDVHVFPVQNMPARSKTRSQARRSPSSTRTPCFSTLPIPTNTASEWRRTLPPAVSTSYSTTTSTTSNPPTPRRVLDGSSTGISS